MQNNLSQINRISLLFQQEYLQTLYLEDEMKNIKKFFRILSIMGIMLAIVLFVISFILPQDLKIAFLASSTFLTLILLIIYFKILRPKKKTLQYLRSVNFYISGLNVLMAVFITFIVNFKLSEILDEMQAKQLYFMFGGCAYAVHTCSLLGTNFIMNGVTLIIINLIYLFSIFPTFPFIIAILIFLNTVILLSHYYNNLSQRTYYLLVNKYFIWYFIANNILKHKLILTRLKKNSEEFELVTSNQKATQQYNLENNENLNELIRRITVYQNHEEKKKENIEDEEENQQNGDCVIENSDQQQCVPSPKDCSKVKLKKTQQKYIIEEELKLDQVQNIMNPETNNIIKEKGQNFGVQEKVFIQTSLEKQMRSINQEPDFQQNFNNQQTVQTGLPNMPQKIQISDQNFGQLFPNQDQLIQQITILKNLFEESGKEQEQEEDEGCCFQKKGFEIKIQSKDSQSPQFNKKDDINTILCQNYEKKTKSANLIAHFIDPKQKENFSKYKMKLELYQLKDIYHLMVIDDQPKSDEKPIINPFLVKIWENSLKFINEITVYHNQIIENLQKIDLYLPQMVFNGVPHGKGVSGIIQKMPLPSSPSKLKEFSAKEIAINLREANFNSFKLNSKTDMFQEYLNLEFMKKQLGNYQIYLDQLIQECIKEVKRHIKHKNIDIFFTCKLKKTQNIIYNDQKQIKLVFTHLLLNSIENLSLNGLVIVDVSRAIDRNNVDNELLGLNSNDFSQVLKIVIRDTSSKKWAAQLNKNEYIFKKNIEKQKSILEKNKLCDIKEIQFAVCQEILGFIGPYNQIFISSEEEGNKNQLSLYLFSNFHEKEEAIQKEIYKSDIWSMNQFHSKEFDDIDEGQVEEQEIVSNTMIQISDPAVFQVGISQRFQRFNSNQQINLSSDSMINIPKNQPLSYQQIKI